MGPVDNQLALRKDCGFSAPRCHMLTVCHFGLITCKTLCIGKMTRRSHFTLAMIRDNQSKSVTVERTRVQKCAVGIRVVDEDLRQVCRYSDVLLSVPRIGLLPPRLFNL